VLIVGGVPLQAGERVAAYRRVHPRMICAQHAPRGCATGVQAEHAGTGRVRADSPRLIADGLYFVGVDIVGDKILEINVFARAESTI